MKTTKLTTVFAVVAVALMFAGCSETESINESLEIIEKSGEKTGLQADTCTFDGVLTAAEIEGLQLMREEEKLARDVYLHFFESYGAVVFQNIAKSEQAHMNAVLKLMEGYEIEDSANDEPGVFNNSELLTLYGELIAKGEQNLVEALQVGATIEDLDIFDLKELLKETQNTDVKRVYTNLLNGSENHMRAFMKALESEGGTYTPQFITANELAEILAGENTSKGNGKGKNGNGQGNSNGNKGNQNSGNGDCDGTGTDAANGNMNGNQSGNANSNGNSNGNSGSKGNGNG